MLERRTIKSINCIVPQNPLLKICTPIRQDWVVGCLGFSGVGEEIHRVDAMQTSTSSEVSEHAIAPELLGLCGLGTCPRLLVNFVYTLRAIASPLALYWSVRLVSA